MNNYHWYISYCQSLVISFYLPVELDLFNIYHYSARWYYNLYFLLIGGSLTCFAFHLMDKYHLRKIEQIVLMLLYQHYCTTTKIIYYLFLTIIYSNPSTKIV